MLILISVVVGYFLLIALFLYITGKYYVKEESTPYKDQSDEELAKFLFFLSFFWPVLIIVLLVWAIARNFIPWCGRQGLPLWRWYRDLSKAPTIPHVEPSEAGYREGAEPCNCTHCKTDP